MSSLTKHSNGDGDHKSEDNRMPPWGDALTLSARVPTNGEMNKDQCPTVVWLLEVGKVAVVIFLNGSVSAKEAKDVGAHPLLVKIADFETRLNTVICHHRAHHASHGVIGEALLEMEELPEKVEDHEALICEITKFVGELQAKQLQHVGVHPHAPPPRAVQRPPNRLEDYKELFRVIPLPAVANNFQTDETFARYRVAGPNPMTIRCITESELRSLIGNRISDQQFNEILKTNGDSIERAGLDGRLCVANYDELSGTSPVVVIGSSFVTDPIAVFAEPLTGGNTIKPVAIQLGQDHVNSELVLANTVDNYRWAMAKTTVQVADMVYHELVAHLAHTHLVMESFSVATQRNLKEDHPVSRLLRPHIEGTNYINNGAATNLVATDGPIDEIFANDRPPRLRSLQGLATRARLAFDFTGRRPDNELSSRGVGRLKVFPYRDDVLDVWRAIQHWAHDYVGAYYEDDKDVVADVALTAWSQDLLVNGDLKNFEAPRTKEGLSDTLAMAMFLASAQHAAVNFPQKQDMTFAPAMAGAVWNNLPPTSEYATEEQWLKLMPPISAAEEQLNVLYLLGSVHYRRLGEYHSNVFPYFGTLEAKVAPALAAFRKELEAVETVIERRNSRRGPFAYRYLLPSEIPASINI